MPCMRKSSNHVYNLTIVCPYCKTKIEYKNVLITNRLYFAEQLVCRNCYKRFFAVNTFKKIANMFYVQLKPIMYFYEKWQNRALKNKA